MSRSTVSITRREEFSASHRLHNPELSDDENQRIFGICNNPNGHGHNYLLEVTVEGPVDPTTGMVMNLLDLMRILHEGVLPSVDHKNLNLDVPFLEGIIPTAENIAVGIWQQIESELGAFERCRLTSIKLRESQSNWVEYRGEA